MLALLSAVSNAGAPPPSDDLDWLTRSRSILDDSSQGGPPQWLRAQSSGRALEAAREVADQSMKVERSTPATSAPGRILIFASFSIPAPTLKSLLEQATDPNVVLVLRGVPSGASVQGTIRRLKKLLPDQLRVPQVLLDPTLFRRYSVERVPSFVLQRPSGQPPVTAIGAINVGWLRRMAASVQPGSEHLGKRAEDYEIAEVDFIAEMQQRLARIDWGARRLAAQAAFWERRKEGFVVLPDAREHRETLIDPSVRVTDDLFDREGNLLVAAGHTINPLEWVPLSKTLVVFRGTDPRHVAKATQLARTARASGRGVILLTTSVDASRGWNHLSELESALSGTVYVLPDTLVDRFRLARIPATVTSRGRQLLVTEVPVGESP